MISLTTNPSRWDNHPIEELFEIVGGVPAPQNDDCYVDVGMPFVRMKDVGRGHLTRSLNKTDDQLDAAFVNRKKWRPVPANSILMPRSGSVGLNHRALLAKPAIIVSHVCALVPKDNRVWAPFAYYASCQLDMRKLTKKTTGLDSLNFSDLKRVAFPLPPLDEQKRIAAILDHADELRRKRQRALNRLNELGQSIFHEMFGDLEKNSKGFPIIELSDAVQLQGGFAFKSANYQDSGIPVVRIGEVNSCFSKRLVFHPPDAKLGRFILRPGELVLSLTGTVGKDDYCNIAKVPDNFLEYYLNQRVARVVVDSNIVDDAFVMKLFSLPYIKHQAIKNNRGIRQANLSNSDIYKIEVPLPPLELQRKFSDQFKQIEAMIVYCSTALHGYDSFFASLQHRAFRGEL